MYQKCNLSTRVINWLSISIILLATVKVHSQNHIIDSLRIVQNNTQISESYVDLTMSISAEFWSIDIDSSIYYANYALLLSKKMNYTRGQARANLGIGMAEVNKSEFDKAEVHLRKALQIAEENSHTSVVAAANNNLGILFYYKKDYYTSFKFYKKGLEINRKIGKVRDIASSLQNIGIIYYENGHYEKAYNYCFEAYEMSKSVNNNSDLPASLNNVAFTLMRLEKFDEALSYVNSAIEASEKNNNYMSLGYAYNIYGELMHEQGKLDESIESYKNALANAAKLDAKGVSAAANVGISEVYFDKNQYQNAITYAQYALDESLEIDEKLQSFEAIKVMFDSYKKLQDPDMVALYAEKYVAYNDIVTQEKENLNFMEEQLDFELAELERSKDEELKHREQRTFILVAIIFFVILILVILNITISKSRLNKAYNAVKVSNEAKLNFLTKMSHEIKTPCNAVIGYSDLLVETKLNDTQRDYVKTINSSAYNLLEMFQDIIQVSQLRQKTGKVSLTEQDLFQLVNDIHKTIKVKVNSSLVQFHLNMDSELKNEVFVDKSKLQQVLYNLLNNAIKYTAQGSIRLDIVIKDSTSSHYMLEFKVTDTGLGIKPENQNKIFEEFFQQESDMTRGQEGSGVGLFIVRELLVLMGSDVELNSTLGEGSVFSFNLNLKKGQELTSRHKGIEPEVIDFKPLEFNSNKINFLIVEDNRVNLMLIKKMLLSVYPEAVIHEADNGEKGVALFADRDIDLVVMDIQMPVMNGFEASEKIRLLKNGHEVPIIAYSAGLLQDNLKKCKESGINDFIEKPIKKTLFLEKIQTYLDMPKDVVSANNFFTEVKNN